ncbi:MAG TPA: hypothetical protein VL528_11420, partial [Oxalicibacterium sp.]|nr:hypothetical protein [Oxalicibacterium sp.]
MSLINKMLQDLEQRHADDTVRSMPQDVRATPMPQRSRAPWMALAVLLVVLVCALLAWRWLRPSAEVRAPVAVAAVSTPAARPTPAAVLMPPSAAASEPAPAPVSAPTPSLALKVDDDLSMKSIAQIPASIAEPSPAAPAAPAPAAAVAAPDVARQT